MNSSMFSLSGDSRPLSIDFNAYTDGDDGFKKKLILLMIDNIRELQSALQVLDTFKHFEAFRATCHRIKATLMMLDDKPLLDAIEEIKNPLQNGEQKLQQIEVLNSTCEAIINSLLAEHNNI